MTFEEWMTHGIKQGWCGPPVCHTHDGVPTTQQEDEDFDEAEPCVHIIRLYESLEQRDEVEANHSPSQWRNHYTTKEEAND